MCLGGSPDTYHQAGLRRGTATSKSTKIETISFVLFNCFAVNQWLQYKQVGRWRDYLVGERVYFTSSLIAKSLLA